MEPSQNRLMSLPKTNCLNQYIGTTRDKGVNKMKKKEKIIAVSMANIME